VSSRIEFKREIGLFMAVMIGIGAMMGRGFSRCPASWRTWWVRSVSWCTCPDRLVLLDRQCGGMRDVRGHLCPRPLSVKLASEDSLAGTGTSI
jgi:hypothetical protein